MVKGVLFVLHNAWLSIGQDTGSPEKFAYSSNNIPLLVLKAYTVELSSALLMSYLLSFLIWL